MTTIGIIGANGQVGSEVCLFLQQYEDIEIVPISRTEIGSVFLRRCGFTPRHGSVSRPEEASALLAGCDLVADFSLPSGSSVEVRQAMHGVISNAIAQAPAGVPFVYLSSITAFGIPDFRGPLKNYRLSRNQYGASKRYAEKLVRDLGAKASRPTYILRVGVVHGELQAVTRQTLQTIRKTVETRTYVPDAPSYTVFAFSIAEALVMIARGRETPDTYTLLSNPAWSWQDLHNYYAAKVSGASPAVVLPAPEPKKGGPAKLLVSTAWKLAAGQKDVLGAYLTTRSHSLETRMRARYARANAAAEIEAGKTQSLYQPYGSNYDEFPGRRLQSLSDSRVTMESAAERVREALREIRNDIPEFAVSRA